MVLLGVGTALGAALARWQMARFFAEQPEYEVEDRLGPLEIRHYDRVVRAETTVEAQTWEDALQEGFRRLASYIFGANRPRELALSELELQGDQATPQPTRAQKIAMTAPVNVRTERHTLSNLASEHAAQAPHSDEKFTVTFTMPKERSTGSLPVPEDTRVRLRSVPPRRVAVLRYSGRHDARRVAEKARQLLEAVDPAGLPTRGEPEFAGYDPPTTLPWLRRNEVWIELGRPTAP
jgi:hypothetical protein